MPTVALQWSSSPSNSPVAARPLQLFSDPFSWGWQLGDCKLCQTEPEAEWMSRASLEGTEEPVADLRPLAKPHLPPRSGDRDSLILELSALR